MFTFRTSITCAVMAFILALAALLIATQVRSLRVATHEAAVAYMDCTISKFVRRLQSDLSTIVSLVRVLSTSSSAADSDHLTETSAAVRADALLAPRHEDHPYAARLIALPCVQHRDSRHHG